MNEAPKKIWEAPKKIWIDAELAVNDVPYIRADLVDGLVEALKTMIESYKREFESHWGASAYEEAEEHEEVLKARAALKALEEE